MRSLLVRGSRFLAQAIAILAMGAGLSEVAMRLYHHVNPVFVFPSDHYSRFRGKPFAPDYGYGFHLNSHGFKDVEYATKRPGTIRILGIGDSFAFGVVPYEYNYLTLLEEDLGRLSPRTEVINMGIPGIGPREYLEVLVNEGLPLGADLVLLSFFIGNDFEVEPAQMPRSYLLAFLRYLLAIRGQGNVIHGPVLYQDDQPTFPAGQYLEAERNRSIVFRRSNGVFGRQVAAVRTHLEQIKRTCDANRMGLLVVVIPDEVQVNAELQSAVVRSFPGEAEDFAFLLPNHQLEADLDQLGISFLDLTESFREAADKRPLYRLRDSHWNIAGNRLAADLIRERLLREHGRFWPPHAR